MPKADRQSRALILCVLAFAWFPASRARAQETGPGGHAEAATAVLTLYGGQATLAPFGFPGAPKGVRSTMGAGIDVLLRTHSAPKSGFTLLLGDAMEYRGECPDRPYQDCAWPSGNGPAEVRIERAHPATLFE